MPSSVEALVAQRVGGAATKIRALIEPPDREMAKALELGDWSDYLARQALVAAGVPALVEALSDLLSYAENATVEWPSEDADAAWRANIERARAVLGGGQVQGRAELEAESERIAQLRATLANLLLYARGNQHVLDLIHAALDKDERLAASTTTPDTPKGASDGE